jgi:Tfp pilus assembly protein PilF
MYPASAIANNNYGAIMLRKELPCATTLPYFLNAIQLDPEYADAYYNAGLCSYELNDLSSARRYLNRFLGMTPDAESAALARGLLNQMNSP